MWIVIIVCIIAVISVLALSIMTLNKGYGYKHTVDPLPDDINQSNEQQSEKKEE
ncbi:YtzI protein [Gracilibacillus sp. S3-1-1]|uniref:YtzI protein n=1 Tax=Gracilibacillus pellucidus TaxID=3095368 RepID=A0ACC6M654_9BACI|nr:YtzI protein [Gracilibacillus sp. S3-1-1]MDX8046366.1 YtzI protein [Gracilibacillus sp. S3-1-1]